MIPNPHDRINAHTVFAIGIIYMYMSSTYYLLAKDITAICVNELVLCSILPPSVNVSLSRVSSIVYCVLCIVCRRVSYVMCFFVYTAV